MDACRILSVVVSVGLVCIYTLVVPGFDDSCNDHLRARFKDMHTFVTKYVPEHSPVYIVLYKCEPLPLNSSCFVDGYRPYASYTINNVSRIVVDFSQLFCNRTDRNYYQQLLAGSPFKDYRFDSLGVFV